MTSTASIVQIIPRSSINSFDSLNFGYISYLFFFGSKFVQIFKIHLSKQWISQTFQTVSNQFTMSFFTIYKCILVHSSQFIIRYLFYVENSIDADNIDRNRGQHTRRKLTMYEIATLGRVISVVIEWTH